ncbi:hypothetical protein GQF16_08530 [Neisseria meningitidis]|nr:hypothetical protein [Neisseria meningitidis]
MLPHTGLFLLGKVALQMRIRHRCVSTTQFKRRPRAGRCAAARMQSRLFKTP